MYYNITANMLYCVLVMFNVGEGTAGKIRINYWRKEIDGDFIISNILQKSLSIFVCIYYFRALLTSPIASMYTAFKIHCWVKILSSKMQLESEKMEHFIYCSKLHILGVLRISAIHIFDERFLNWILVISKSSHSSSNASTICQNQN